MAFDSYQAVTDNVIAALESGRVPWQTPWNVATGRPRSMSTGKAYTGINVLLLGVTAEDRGYRSPWWGTRKAINKAGGHIRKGQSRDNGCGGTLITYWHTYSREVEKADGSTGTKSGAVLYVYTVYNAEQCEGLPAKYTDTSAPAPVAELDEPEAVLAGYFGSPDGPTVKWGGRLDGADYHGGTDTIRLPRPEQFKSPEAKYAVAYHEATHSTGHASRLDRPGIVEFDHFGSERYAQEELIAQMGAAFLCAATGVEYPIEQSADYIRGWLTALANDKKMIVHAASAAEKATKLIMDAGHPAQAQAA